MAWLEIDGKDIPLLEPPVGQKETPRRILQTVFKYKRFIRIAFLSIFLPLFAYVLLLPQEYIAVTKVLIKPSRAYMNLTPGTGDNTLSINPSPEVLNSEIQLIKGRELRQRLFKEIPFPDKGFFSARGGLEASPVRGTSILAISLTSTNPEWTTRAVNRAAEIYQEQSVNLRKTQGIEQFYDDQDRRLRTDLLKAEQDLKEFQQREGIVDATKEVDASLVGLAAAERSLKDTESQLRETEKKISVLDEQLRAQQPTISTSKSISADPTYTKVRDRLTQLELERQSLLQRYLPKDRLVLEKEREIADLKKRLEEVEKTSVGSENIALNEVHRRILNELLAARVQLQALREKRAAEIGQVASYSSSAGSKKKLSFEYDRLQQVVRAKSDALALYNKRAEEARISNAMDDQKFSNAVIMERAAMPAAPAGRSTLVWFFVLAFLSATVSIGLAFAINYFDPTIQDEAYLEEEFGLPVLAAIQHYDTRQPDYFIAKT